MIVMFVINGAFKILYMICFATVDLLLCRT